VDTGIACNVLTAVAPPDDGAVGQATATWEMGAVEHADRGVPSR
jgi:hypothetical protein